MDEGKDRTPKALPPLPAAAKPRPAALGLLGRTAGPGSPLRGAGLAAPIILATTGAVLRALPCLGLCAASCSEPWARLHSCLGAGGA